MTDSAYNTDVPKRFRSPSYPALSLSKAIERAKQLHSKAQHHAVSAEVLAEAWNYGIKSSGLATTAAALGQYDLLYAVGASEKRVFKLTNLAIRIVSRTDTSSWHWIDAIQRAALQPPIHRELWDKFLSATHVHDVELRKYLTADRAQGGSSPFSDAAADDVVRTYRKTLAFAGIGQSKPAAIANDDEFENGDTGTLSEERRLEIEFDSFSQPILTDQKANVTMGEREITTGLLSKDASFRLLVTGQIGVKEIERLIAKLEIDKSILADADGAGLDA